MNDLKKLAQRIRDDPNAAGLWRQVAEAEVLSPAEWAEVDAASDYEDVAVSVSPSARILRWHNGELEPIPALDSGWIHVPWKPRH